MPPQRSSRKATRFCTSHLSSVHHRLETGSAESVHAQGWPVNWDATVQEGVSRHKSAPIWCVRHNVSNVDSVDLFRAQTGHFDGSLWGGNLQGKGIGILECATIRSKGRSFCGNNEDTWEEIARARLSLWLWTLSSVPDLQVSSCFIYMQSLTLSFDRHF